MWSNNMIGNDTSNGVMAWKYIGMYSWFSFAKNISYIWWRTTHESWLWVSELPSDLHGISRVNPLKKLGWTNPRAHDSWVVRHQVWAEFQLTTTLRHRWTGQWTGLLGENHPKMNCDFNGCWILLNLPRWTSMDAKNVYKMYKNVRLASWHSCGKSFGTWLTHIPDISDIICSRWRQMWHHWRFCEWDFLLDFRPYLGWYRPSQADSEHFWIDFFNGFYGL